MRAERTYVQMLLLIPLLAILLALLMWTLGLGFTAQAPRASRAPLETALQMAEAFHLVAEGAVEAKPGFLLGARP